MTTFYGRTSDPWAASVRPDISAGLIDLAIGDPNEMSFPTGALEVSPNRRTSALRYGARTGDRELISALADTLHRDLSSVVGTATVISNGALDALAIAFRANLRPGTAILAEDVTFPGLMWAAHVAGITVATIPEQRSAADVEAIAQRVREFKSVGIEVGGIYLMPSCANPTGRAIPDTVLDQIAAAATSLQLVIFEDDAYRDISFNEQIPKTLLSRVPDLVVHIRTLSKVLAPGLRLASTTTSPRLADAMAQLMPVGGVSPIASQIATQVLTSDNFPSYYEGLLREYRERMELVVQAASAAGLETHSPVGGFFAWINTGGVGGRAATKDLEEVGISVLPGAAFSPEGFDVPFIRVSFARAPRAQLAPATSRIAALITARNARRF